MQATTTTFTVAIELGNDAMQEPNEVADALYRVARKLENDGNWAYVDEGTIRDINGNTVGSWKLEAVTK